MSQRRTLILVAAIAIGALASFLVWNYVNGIQDEAYSGAQRVPVYLIKQQVARGTTGAAAQPLIVKENIPRKFKPANAITNVDDISGKVALSNLVPNQVVVSDMFVEPSDPRAQNSFAERLVKIRDKDQVAITVQVDLVRGVAGLLQPGDYVNVLLTNIVQTDQTGEKPPEGVDANKILFNSSARYMFQKVRILAIDKAAVPQTGEAAATVTGPDGQPAPAPAAAATNQGLVTLIVPALGAQYLASVEADRIYLSLVAPDYVPVPQDRIDPADPIPAEDPSQLTPYGPDGAEAAN